MDGPGIKSKSFNPLAQGLWTLVPTIWFGKKMRHTKQKWGKKDLPRAKPSFRFMFLWKRPSLWFVLWYLHQSHLPPRVSNMIFKYTWYLHTTSLTFAQRGKSGLVGDVHNTVLLSNFWKKAYFPSNICLTKRNVSTSHWVSFRKNFLCS